MWNFVIAWVISAAISALLAPRPNVQDAQPGQLGDKDLPMANRDAPIPVLFGTRVLSQPNVVWWGQVQVIPIRKSGGGKK